MNLHVVSINQSLSKNTSELLQLQSFTKYSRQHLITPYENTLISIFQEFLPCFEKKIFILAGTLGTSL